LVACRSADQRIAALNDPSLVPLRKLMAKDITTLKSIPIIDRDGLVLRLTALQQQVDDLPLADFSENFITFRSRDGNIIPLLSPQQHFYLKENMKAKLETAIKAVYIEQQDIYIAALDTAEQWSHF